MFSMPVSTLRYYEDMGILTNVGRTASGQRVYQEGHVNRLRTICCFKNAGMSIAQLQAFFDYEQDEAAHIDDILALLEGQRSNVSAQIARLEHDYEHLMRKLRYYGDIKKSLEEGTPRPDWGDYRRQSF